MLHKSYPHITMMLHEKFYPGVHCTYKMTLAKAELVLHGNIARWATAVYMWSRSSITYCTNVLRRAQWYCRAMVTSHRRQRLIQTGFHKPLRFQKPLLPPPQKWLICFAYVSDDFMHKKNCCITKKNLSKKKFFHLAKKYIFFHHFTRSAMSERDFFVHEFFFNFC